MPEPLKGHPFSAVQEVDGIAGFLDGTQAILKHQERLYRDSAGRIRIETFAPVGENLAQGAPEMVAITNPVAHLSYTLNPSTHVGHSAPLVYPTFASPASRSALQPPGIADDVDEYVSKVRACRFPNKRSEDLGTEMMEGVLVKGERTTWTLPVDCVQNQRPITETDEVWTSTDLELTILLKHSYPHNGDTVTRVVSIDQFEPDPALFQVPQNYTLQNP